MVTVTVTDAVWLKLPLVAVTRTVNVASGVLRAAVTVRDEVENGPTVNGTEVVRPRFPVRAGVAERLTVLLKPLAPVMLTVNTTEPPRGSDCEDGDTASVKSGWGAGVTFTVICVEFETAPLVPATVIT